MIFGPGDRIGDYEVLCPLGAGGMGSVYKVRHAISQRIEALKVILPGTLPPLAGDGGAVSCARSVCRPAWSIRTLPRCTMRFGSTTS